MAANFKYSIAACVALLFSTAMLAQPADAAARCAKSGCKPAVHARHRVQRARDWYLHQPSTPSERAETARLNREYLDAAQATQSDPGPATGRPRALQAQDTRPRDMRPPYAPEQPAPPQHAPPPFPPRADMRAPYEDAKNARAPNDYMARNPAHYEDDLRRYRQASRIYDQQLKAYDDLMRRSQDKKMSYSRYPDRHPANAPYAGIKTVGAPARYGSAPYRSMPSADVRLDPWHGYNAANGLGNGY